MPASRQHFVLLQLSPEAEQTSATQLATVAPPAGCDAALTGVRSPNFSQLHFRWLHGSLGSTPGVQFDLHWAQNSSRT